ncbi:hypothetical protein PR048_010610, partial [Dryococelus australis]
MLSIIIEVNDRGSYAVIVDGTQDIPGTDQQPSDQNLQPQEQFTGLHSMVSTIGESLLQLPLSNLRGQTYEGAANMSGQYNGAQAIVKMKHPLAHYVHCTASNRVAASVARSCSVISKPLECVNELGVL